MVPSKVVDAACTVGRLPPPNGPDDIFRDAEAADEGLREPEGFHPLAKGESLVLAVDEAKVVSFIQLVLGFSTASSAVAGMLVLELTSSCTTRESGLAVRRSRLSRNCLAIFTTFDPLL